MTRPPLNDARTQRRLMCAQNKYAHVVYAIRRLPYARQEELLRAVADVGGRDIGLEVARDVQFGPRASWRVA